MPRPMTDAHRFQNALRILHSLDEVADVLPDHIDLGAFHRDPALACMTMDEPTFARVYALIERRQPAREVTQ